MKFADFVSREAIKADLAADDKEGVIREMVQALLAAQRIASDEFESIVNLNALFAEGSRVRATE